MSRYGFNGKNDLPAIKHDGTAFAPGTCSDWKLLVTLSMLILSFLWLAAVVILIGRALRQRTIFKELGKAPSGFQSQGRVTIIVPARNEEANIETCLKSLVAQTYPESCLRIVAVDDNSTDCTAEIAKTFAAGGRVTLLHAPPLPQGWTGKSHACWIAASKEADRCEWLCFTDADIDATPELIKAAVFLAAGREYDFLSLTPKQRLVSFSERLVMPCGLYLLGFSQNLNDVNAPASKDITATGQFILIRSSVYKAIGGHEAVRSDICEDVALARLVKAQGYRTALFGGSDLYSTRMYRGWSTLWPGVTKNLTAMLGGPLPAVLAAFIGLALAWAAPLLPFADASGAGSSVESKVALAMAAPASAAAFGLHLAGTRFFRIPFWYGLIFPLGYTIGAVLACDSVRRHLTGQISWKGRLYS